MIGVLAGAADARGAAADAMAEWLAGLPAGPIAVLGHFDADGLGATAILARALAAAGREVEAMTVGKTESPWDEAVADRIGASGAAGLILTDLGTRGDSVVPGLPTLVIDHHVPTGAAPDTLIISGNGLSPEPTSALLAWWAAGALGDQSDLEWLAAIGLIGDMADEGFPELAEAQARWGKTALRDATALVNAPRRTGTADASPALRLLMRGDGPKAITKGDDADTAALHAARAEVRAAVEEGRRQPPVVAGDVALIRLDTPCQIHPLIAQAWRGRLKDKIVIAANRGYRPGWVHFAARSATGRDLIAFLADHRPGGADGRYGNGHAQATGGALPYEQWNAFVADIGFPQARIDA